MSERGVERALARLDSGNAVLAPDRGAGFGVFAGGDRRRRPLARLDERAVRALEASGALQKAGDDAFVLSEAGRARVRRERASPGEAFQAQHGGIVERPIVEACGAVRTVRGYDRAGAVRRLSALRGANGRAWLTSAELRAAERLRQAWAKSEIGLVRGSDWAAPPKGRSPRGGAQDAAMAARCDARRELDDMLDKLAPPLRRVVERVCLHEDGVEALERAEGWPSRSGKLALKLGLAQLAVG